MFTHAMLVIVVWIAAAARLGGCAEPPHPAGPVSEDAPPMDQPLEGDADRAQDSVEQLPPPDIASMTAEELLDRLEAAATDLTTFQANISHRETDPIFDAVTTTTGSVIYSIGADNGKRFAILFKQQIKDAALRDFNEHYIFDGEWLVQKNFDNKDFIKRQIVRPGEEFDPLKLGEGPFPIPIGQRKADVLSRFNVAMAEPPPEGEFLGSNLKDEAVWGLALSPKAGTPEAEDFKLVTVYYDRATLLPAGIDIVKSGGEREQVLLAGRVRNGEIDESLIDTTVPESGWRVDIRPWRGNE